MQAQIDGRPVDCFRDKRIHAVEQTELRAQFSDELRRLEAEADTYVDLAKQTRLDSLRGA